jgi:amino acid transporter
MRISLANRLWIGLISGAIAALIASIILALFGLPDGLFGGAITASFVATVVVGAIVGLLYGLSIRPNRDYLQSTLGGLVLGLIIWAIIAVISPLFVPTNILSGFNLTSLIGLLLFGSITGLIYSIVASSLNYYNYEEKNKDRRFKKRSYGISGGETRSNRFRKNKWSNRKSKDYPDQ